MTLTRTSNWFQKTFPSTDKWSKWAIPVCFAGLGFYVQSVGLHYATYSYIHKYVVGAGIDPRNNTFATLDDPVQDFFGYHLYDIHWLDTLASIFPGGFLAGSLWLGRVYEQNALQLWTKVMLCAGFLFTIKGIMGAVTIIPDSSGWEVCKNRLTPAGVQWMMEEHSFASMLVLDFQWILLWYMRPLRYCSDMMYSGHTFIVTLFALGLYELVRMARLTAGKGEVVLLTTVAAVAISEQVLEIYYVERSHFHYTSDIIMALIMVFLLYTNGVIAIAAKNWATDGLFLFPRFREKMQTAALEGSTWVRAEERLLKDKEEKLHQAKAEQSKRPSQGCFELLKCLQNLRRTVRAITIVKEKEDQCKGPDHWSTLISKGDIFVPPCCIPCCCYAGREHIYSDNGVKLLLDQFIINKEDSEDKKMVLRAQLLEFLSMEMSLNEGVSLTDFVSFTRDTFACEAGAASSGAAAARAASAPLQEPLLLV